MQRDAGLMDSMSMSARASRSKNELWLSAAERRTKELASEMAYIGKRAQNIQKAYVQTRLACMMVSVSLDARTPKAKNELRLSAAGL